MLLLQTSEAPDNPPSSASLPAPIKETLVPCATALPDADGVRLGDLVRARVVDTDGIDLVAEVLEVLPAPEPGRSRSGAAVLLPYSVLGPFVGVLLDRWPRRRILVVSQVLRGLSMLADLPWWITLVILSREIGITLLRIGMLRHGVIAASPGGKVKTLVQVLAIGLYILPLHSLPVPHAAVDGVRIALMAAAVGLTIATGIDYLMRAGALASRSKRARRAGST